MWAFSAQSDWDYIDNLEKLFASCGAQVYYVELEAEYDLRLKRNKTENRLANKPSKRNLEWSEKIFVYLEGKHRLNSLKGELAKENYMRIDNSALPPERVAQMIKERFLL